MSKRRKEIEELLNKLNYHSFKAADMASLDTREKKPKNISLAEMKQIWKGELAKVGFSSKEFLSSLPSLAFLSELEKNKDKKLEENQEIQKVQKIQEKLKSENINFSLAIDTVKDATWYLSQYKLKLDYTKIISQAIEFAIGKTTHRDIVLATNKLIKDGFLISLSLDKSDTIFVTKELIETEKTIMELVDNSKNKWTNFALKHDGANIAFTASDEIKKHAFAILQSKHRVSLVDSGKSGNKELIASILELAESSGKTVRVLSPNRLIANDINENITRRKPNNLWQWLISLGKPEVGESVAGFIHKYKEEVELPTFLLRLKQGKDVVVVNNTETLGCNYIRTLLELTEKSNAKVILLRDTTDKRYFGAGNPIETLNQAGIERFKTPELENIEKLEKTPDTPSPRTIPELKIVKDNNKRILQLAKEYALRENKENKENKNSENTIILVGSKEQLKATNEAIRKELRQHGKISGLEYSVLVLNPVYMSKPEAILAHKYHQNMVIRFYGGVPNDWNVGYCDREANTLKLVRGNQRTVWNPKKQHDKENKGNTVKYGVFKKETLRIAKGDKLIATGNMYDLGIKSGIKFTVGEVNGNSIELLHDTGKANNNTKEPKTIKVNKVNKISLDKLKNKNSHFQYDYATTLNRSLKNPVANVIADFKAYLLDKPTIDELTKRAKETLTIFTNDGEVAKKRFSHIPVKITATEMLLSTSETVPSTDVTIKNTLNNKTITEIKHELEKAIGVLRDQYAFGSQDERKAVEFAIEKITSRNAGFDYRDLAKEALEYALEELISKQNKEVTLEDIKKIIEEKRVSGELIMGEHPDDGIKWTTKEALELERSITNNLKKGANKLTPLVDPKNLKIPTEVETGTVNLTKDQKNAISLITTTKDQYVIVQGYAGTGKTAMFAEVHKILKEEKSNNNNNKDNENNKKEKTKILGLAPNHKAVKELKAIGIKAQTLKSFLIAQKTQERIERNRTEQEKQERQAGQLDIGDKIHKNTKINILDNKLVILDEFSMVPNEDLFRFTEIVNNSKAHVVYSGDTDQHLPIGSGKPIDNAQKGRILKTVFLKEIVRQKNPNIKEAVTSTINKNYAYALDKIEQDNPQNYIERIKPSILYGENVENGKNGEKSHMEGLNQADLDFEFFKNLQKSIIEIDNNELKPDEKKEKTLEKMVAEDFLTRTPEIRDKTVIIVHANDDRKVITEYIRIGLKKQGFIGKTGILVNCLTAKGFTSAEHKSLKSYGTGDVIKLVNKYYNVVEVDVEAKSLLLKDGSGKTRHFYPEKEVDKYNMELYSHTKEELAIGDVIRLTKTDKKRGLFANFEYRVKEINDKQAVLESKDKEKSQITLNHRKLKDSHWDYAQTVTGYGVQGASKEYAIDFEVSYRKFLANVRSFYIGISRAISHLVIYTDNKAKFLKQLLRNPGNKYSALEVVGELKEKETPNIERNIQDIKNIKKIEKQINADFYSVKETKLTLENQAEAVVKNLLGEPNNKLSSSTEWRYGNKGSLVINMASNKRGLWYNFETGESGNLIRLLQKELGLNFPQVLKYASDRFGGFLSQDHILPTKINKDQTQLVNKDSSKNTEANIEKNIEKNKTSEYAQKLAKESLPISGTIVEKYLKEHRGIKSIEGEDIRYHPKVFTGKNEKQKYLPAMLSIGRDKDGNIQCVQATYLDPKTANKADLDVKKRTYASPSGVLVSLERQEQESIEPDTNENNKSSNNNKSNKNDKKNKISFIAEGVETGLSVKDAVGGMKNTKNSEVVVTLGKSNFTSIDPQSIGDKVVFCLDNDGQKTFTDSTIHKAAERLIGFGKEVFIAIPGKINDKKDKNNESNRNTEKNEESKKKRKNGF